MKPRKSLLFQQISLKVLALKSLKSEATRYAAKRQITRLNRYFGKKPIKKISEHSWAKYVQRERAKRQRTFYDDRKYMKMVLLYAFRHGVLKKVIELPIPDLPSEAGREITIEEIRKLLCFAGPELRFQIEIAWKMGLRLSEMLHLRWDQIDWAAETITLRAKDTKTRKKRVVPINPDLLGRFQIRFRRRTSLFVFPSPKNPDRPQKNNKTAWRRCKKKAGIEARWHDLRHSCATQMMRKKGPPHLIKAYLGMSQTVLQRIYVHVTVGELRRVARLMSVRARARGY